MHVMFAFDVCWDTSIWVLVSSGTQGQPQITVVSYDYVCIWKCIRTTG